MSYNPKISKIHSIFNHNNRKYILFSLVGEKFEFLYFNHFTKEIRALFYGIDLKKAIENLLKNKSLLISNCIECSLGSKIMGGVSLDGKDSVEFKFLIDKANKLVKILIRKTNLELPFFPGKNN